MCIDLFLVSALWRLFSAVSNAWNRPVLAVLRLANGKRARYQPALGLGRGSQCSAWVEPADWALHRMRPESKAMDTMSEVSEGTTGTSVSGRGSTYSEDLHDFALQIGLSGPDQLYQDRFRVDRRKLELMIRGVFSATNYLALIHCPTCTTSRAYSIYLLNFTYISN